MPRCTIRLCACEGVLFMSVGFSKLDWLLECTLLNHSIVSTFTMRTKHFPALLLELYWWLIQHQICCDYAECKLTCMENKNDDDEKGFKIKLKFYFFLFVRVCSNCFQVVFVVFFFFSLWLSVTIVDRISIYFIIIIIIFYLFTYFKYTNQRKNKKAIAIERERERDSSGKKGSQNRTNACVPFVGNISERAVLWHFRQIHSIHLHSVISLRKQIWTKDKERRGKWVFWVHSVSLEEETQREGQHTD